MYIDPDGRQVVGMTRADAQKFLQDLFTIFAGSEFDKFRELLTLNRRGTTFNSISLDALAVAFEGIDLTIDQRALVDELVGVINSESIHKVEYVDVDKTVSVEGTAAFKNHMNNAQEGIGDAMVPNPRMLGALMNRISGGGINIPTEGGSHSVIMEGRGVVHDHGRALTAGHEVIGHGVASANRASDVDNQIRAVRVDNLIRRIMGLPPYPNAKHGNVLIPDPSRLP